MTDATEIPSAEVDTWATAEGRPGGRISLLRYRPGLSAFLGDPRYARLLRVVWSYGDDGDSGLPSEETIDAMRQLEDRLVQTFESERAGVIAFVFTHAGEREWGFYVNEENDLGGLINAALADLPRLPIELGIENDAEWSGMSEVLSSVREKAS